MALEHLWATWRAQYVRSATDAPGADGDDVDVAAGVAEGDGSLFERILAAPGDDRDKHILRRNSEVFVILNRFPYTVGHLMVLPLRAVPDLEDLTADEHRELWATVTDSVAALKAGLGCDAVNVGLNLGAAAGGSLAEHLHVHCVPRWLGDANFMTVSAGTRVLPISLDEVADRIGDAWPVEPLGS